MVGEVVTISPAQHLHLLQTGHHGNNLGITRCLGSMWNVTNCHTGFEGEEQNSGYQICSGSFSRSLSGVSNLSRSINYIKKTKAISIGSFS